jgi:hypothetical protein
MPVESGEVDWGDNLLKLILDHAHRATEEGGYALLANVGRLESIEYEIAPGVKLRRATQAEVAEILVLFRWWHLLDGPGRLRRNPFDTTLEKVDISATGWSELPKALPEADHRYHVVEFSGSNIRLLDAVDASAICEKELELAIELHFTPVDGLSFGARPRFEKFLDKTATEDDLFLNVEDGDIAEIVRVCEFRPKHDNSVIDLQSAWRDYMALRDVPEQSPLRLLGYFAILESLTTHKPDDKDPADSITKQVRSKMALLNNRFDRPIAYDDYFAGTVPDKIWSKLYALRSDVAHGSIPSFEGALQALGDMRKATQFVQMAVKRVMRQALIEPRLVADLRRC